MTDRSLSALGFLQLYRNKRAQQRKFYAYIFGENICLKFPLLGSFFAINLKKPQSRKWSICQSFKKITLALPVDKIKANFYKSDLANPFHQRNEKKWRIYVFFGYLKSTCYHNVLLRVVLLRINSKYQYGESREIHFLCIIYYLFSLIMYYERVILLWNWTFL